MFFFSHNVFYPDTNTEFNPFPHNDTFWRAWETSLLKTLWEMEKMLVTMFSTLSKTEISFLLLNLSSANAFNLISSKISSFGNGLIVLEWEENFGNSKKKQYRKQHSLDFPFQNVFFPGIDTFHNFPYVLSILLLLLFIIIFFFVFIFITFNFMKPFIAQQ